MWDALVFAGNLIIIPAMLATAMDKNACIPRLTSGISLVGITAVVIGLIGAGLVLSPIVVSILGLSGSTSFCSGTSRSPYVKAQ